MEEFWTKTPRSAPEGNTKTSGANTARCRAWCGTTNNWTQVDWESIQQLGDYGCVAQEVAPTTGTPHLQWYLYFSNKTTFSALQKKLPRSHIEICKGDATENRKYIFGPYSKDGKEKPANPTAIEWGEMPKQGARRDLEKLRNEIVSGKKVDELIMEDPFVYHMYGRTLTKLEDLQMRKKFRTEMTKGIWYWGKTGVGKSHKAFEGFHPDTHYDVPLNDGGWWDGYTQQDTVIINEFRGEIKFPELLKMVDKWNYSVKRRNREPMPFISKTVIITSACPPEEIYRHSLTENDKLEQFSRRFEIIELTSEKLEN